MTHNNDNQNPLMNKHSDMLAMISHDLKSPMNGILGATDFLLQEIKGEKPDASDCKDALKIIEKAGHNMMELIGNIVSMSKLEAGSEVVHTDWVQDLSEMVENIIQTFKYEARVNDITLSTHITSELPAVNWDLNKIHYHVINNIVSNALRHTPAGGRIVVSADYDDEMVVIRILDSGPGIPESERRRIFKRFECIDITSSRAYHSHGLGLYNAHLFVQQHGGKIRVEDGLDDTGICFAVILPIDPFATATEATTSPSYAL
ncbi:MAG: hypothetical protein GQ470_05865 [Gammaproteobacteria bacterium]|nr:hypothetical protein [Gammaproteobacteria bacterium]